MSMCSDFPIANPKLVLREEFDDWAVLFDPDTGNAYGMNPTSVFIYKHLNGKASVDSILMELKTDFETVPEEAKAQVEKFISDLSAKGLVGFEVQN